MGICAVLTKEWVVLRPQYFMLFPTSDFLKIIIHQILSSLNNLTVLLPQITRYLVVTCRKELHYCLFTVKFLYSILRDWKNAESGYIVVYLPSNFSITPYKLISGNTHKGTTYY